MSNEIHEILNPNILNRIGSDKLGLTLKKIIDSNPELNKKVENAANLIQNIIFTDYKSALNISYDLISFILQENEKLISSPIDILKDSIKKLLEEFISSYPTFASKSLDCVSYYGNALNFMNNIALEKNNEEKKQQFSLVLNEIIKCSEIIKVFLSQSNQLLSKIDDSIKATKEALVFANTRVTDSIVERKKIEEEISKINGEREKESKKLEVYNNSLNDIMKKKIRDNRNFIDPVISFFYESEATKSYNRAEKDRERYINELRAKISQEEEYLKKIDRNKDNLQSHLEYSKNLNNVLTSLLNITGILKTIVSDVSLFWSNFMLRIQEVNTIELEKIYIETGLEEDLKSSLLENALQWIAFSYIYYRPGFEIYDKKKDFFDKILKYIKN